MYAFLYENVRDKDSGKGAVLVQKTWDLLKEPGDTIWFGWGKDTITGEEGFLVLYSS